MKQIKFAKGENSMKLHRGDIIDIFKPETIAEQILVDQGKDDGIHRYLLWNINNDAVSHYVKNGADMLIKANTIVGIGLTPYGEEIDLTIDDILKGHPKVVKHISIEVALHNIFMSNKYDIDVEDYDYNEENISEYEYETSVDNFLIDEANVEIEEEE